MLNGRRSIPTLYGGILFRSKLEADWARCFDSLRMPWQYEPVGLYAGDTFVLVDFWLPEARQLFEVKGRLSEDDRRKFAALTGWLARESENSEEPLPPFVVFGWPGGAFSLGRTGGPGELQFCADTAALGDCDRCRTRYFLDTAGSWTCPGCCRRGSGLAFVREQGAAERAWSGWPGIRRPLTETGTGYKIPPD
jgi:hypothetical protein